MMRRLVCLLSCLFLLSVSNAFCQDAQDAADLEGLIFVPEKHKVSTVKLLEVNVEEFITGSLFNFYKQFISSQDANVCTFEPSCSVYALNSVKKNGLVLGVIDAFDRLVRCNGLNDDKYNYHEHSGKLHDPVK